MKKALIALVTVAILALFALIVQDSLQARARNKAFCKHWLQTATPSDSIKLYRARPDCIYYSEE